MLCLHFEGEIGRREGRFRKRGRSPPMDDHAINATTVEGKAANSSCQSQPPARALRGIQQERATKNDLRGVDWPPSRRNKEADQLPQRLICGAAICQQRADGMLFAQDAHRATVSTCVHAHIAPQHNSQRRNFLPCAVNWQLMRKNRYPMYKPTQRLPFLVDCASSLSWWILCECAILTFLQLNLLNGKA